MRAYEIGSQDGLHALTAVTRPDLRAGPGEVILRVSSVCLNHRDLLVLKRRYGPLRPSHRIPVSDGVGEVIEIGAGVSGVTLGQRVTCGHFVGWADGAFHPSMLENDLGVSVDGWLAEQIRVPASALLPVPDTLADDDVAALPAAGVTAWNALTEAAQVRAGDLVLALGTGGVSIFALQLAKLHGARVAITSSSDEKLEQMKALGADITINYRTQPDWAAALLAANGGAGGGGANIIIETGGLATLSQSIAAAAPNASIVLIGALGGAGPVNLPNFSSVIIKNLRLRGVTAGNRRMYHELLTAAATHRLHPVIDKRFAFDDAPAAYACLEAGQHIGKILINIS